MPWERVGELCGHRVPGVLCLSPLSPYLSLSSSPSSIEEPTTASGGSPFFCSGGQDGTIRLWDLAVGRSVRAMMAPRGKPVNALCIGRAASHNFVLAAAGRLVFGYDLRAPGMVLRVPAVPSLGKAAEEVSCLAMDERGQAVAIGDDSGELRVVDLDGDALPELDVAHGSICACAQFRPGARLELLSGGMDSCIVRWDGSSGSVLRAWDLAPPAAEGPPAQLVNPRHVHSLAYAPGGSCFAVALGDGSVEIRGSDEGELLAAVEDAHRAAASQVLFAPSLTHTLPACDASTALPLLSAGDDSELRVWRVRSVAADDGISGGIVIDGVGRVRLEDKPNAIALSGDIVCVAGTSDRLALFRYDPLADELDRMDLL
eukprot:scaffold79061_cov30-Tisochrysis_lutea.AAC.6